MYRVRPILILAPLVLGAAICWGDIDDDPLHGYCSVGCVDNGTNSPTTQNPITSFGFTISPGPASGDFLIDVLVPSRLVARLTLLRERIRAPLRCSARATGPAASSRHFWGYLPNPPIQSADTSTAPKLR